MTAGESFSVLDKTGKQYTFFKEGTDCFFALGDRTDYAERIRIEAFTSPRGAFRCFVRGLVGKGDFKFLDANGHEWEVKAPAELLSKFMAWSTVPPASLMRDIVLDVLSTEMLHRLEAAESVDGEYDLLIETRVAPISAKGQDALRPDNIALLALSADKALLVTEDAKAAPKLAEAVTRFPIGALSLLPISEISTREASPEGKAFAVGLRLKTHGHNTVCRLRTALGHEVWLQMDTGDIASVRERLGTVSKAA